LLRYRVPSLRTRVWEWENPWTTAQEVAYYALRRLR